MAKNTNKKILRAERKKGEPRRVRAELPRSCEDCPIHKNSNPSFRFLDQAPHLPSFTDLSTEDQKLALDSFRKMEERTWGQVYQTGTKEHGKRTGLCYGPVGRNSFKHEIPGNIPEGKTISHFRFGGERRIFGFRVDSAFHVCWFDPNHDSTDG